MKEISRFKEGDFCSQVAGVVFGLVLVLVFFSLCADYFLFRLCVPLFFLGWFCRGAVLCFVLLCFPLVSFVWPALFVGVLAWCLCFGWLGPCLPLIKNSQFKNIYIHLVFFQLIGRTRLNSSESRLYI